MGAVAFAGAEKIGEASDLEFWPLIGGEISPGWQFLRRVGPVIAFFAAPGRGFISWLGSRARGRAFADARRVVVGARQSPNACAPVRLSGRLRFPGVWSPQNFFRSVHWLGWEPFGPAWAKRRAASCAKSSSPLWRAPGRTRQSRYSHYHHHHYLLRRFGSPPTRASWRTLALPVSFRSPGYGF